MAKGVDASTRPAVPARARLRRMECCTKACLTRESAGCRKAAAASDVCGQSWRRRRPTLNKNPRPVGAWGSLDADLGFRTSVMAAAGMLRQGFTTAIKGSGKDTSPQVLLLGGFLSPLLRHPLPPQPDQVRPLFGGAEPLQPTAMPYLHKPCTGDIGVDHLHPVRVERLAGTGDAHHLVDVRGAQSAGAFAAPALLLSSVLATHAGSYATCSLRRVAAAHRAGISASTRLACVSQCSASSGSCASAASNSPTSRWIATGPRLDSTSWRASPGSQASSMCTPANWCTAAITLTNSDTRPSLI